MTYALPLPFAATLGNWLTQKWVQDFSFRLHDPSWRLSKSTIPGVKFDRPRFDELAKAVKNKIKRLPGGDYIKMYMEGLLFIGPIPLHVAGVSEQNQRTYFEDHQTPVAPVFPTMLVKVKAGGGYSKASTDLVDTYMREMAEYTSLLNVLNSLPFFFFIKANFNNGSVGSLAPLQKY